MTLAVVRVRGVINVKNDIRDTLTMLGLGRVNHCILLNETPESMGMLLKVKDYVTWGSIDADTAATLVKERGRMSGGKPLDEKALKALGKYKSFEDLGKALADGDVVWSKMDGTVRVFRLHPPRKGLRSIKRPYKMGGDLGDRGEGINALLQNMM